MSKKGREKLSHPFFWFLIEALVVANLKSGYAEGIPQVAGLRLPPQPSYLEIGQ